ncbi:TonB system transport protein ExbD [Metapseudomonas furukawaii]|jgi:biopolymer transport protein ExbD|uniref:Biopolymer transport protein ExbD n=1 Tax=Metapseudomonas furukawaii TaxID=1149133 RepID=A0AAD1FHY5_METFU|nr:MULTISPECIES: TonB system transport protein ExbD [Pseudomonas]ELS29797.1 Biopolymer transport protein ExbD/TolR [Pseudomonas furukawaii]OWJ95449.1 biopolymer transport protein ExbD [Pseudomonas sp. A46]WAG78943.1 TonB system transport protein ExbD [Pseudomonas furukawaii]BAU77275.1 biopolymer transport protein [Pseudomonas furukawaii]
MGIHLKEGDDDLQETHEINVTPFIDVMLVLLIIFMVAAPLATVDIKVDLPASTAKPAPRPDKPIYLSIKEDKSLYLDNDPVTEEQLAATLDKLTNADKDKTIFVRGDKVVEYGRLMEVMDALRGAGYLKIGLVGLETVGNR